MAIFDVAQRQRIRDRLVARARADGCIASAALVGSLAEDAGDRWSDLDLTFGVAEDARLEDVLADWSRFMVDELRADVLIDLRSGGALYRVFLLDDGQQVDLSFAPQPAVRQASPRFSLLFGTATQTDPAPPDAAALLGWAVIHVRHARVCLERGRLWQAAYCVNQVRDNAMAIAAVGHGLPAAFGRGFDDLPAEVRARFEPALVGELSSDALRAGLERVTEALVAVAEPVVPDAERLTARARRLVHG